MKKYHINSEELYPVFDVFPVAEDFQRAVGVYIPEQLVAEYAETKAKFLDLRDRIDACWTAKIEEELKARYQEHAVAESNAQAHAPGRPLTRTEDEANGDAA